MQTIVFDVETGPLAEGELSALLPPFDPAEVKTGNLKDPDKIAAKIAEAEANHRRDFVDKAALDPLTGRVVAIGVLVFDVRGEAGPEFTKFESAASHEMDSAPATLTRPADTLSHCRGRGTSGAGEGQGGRCIILGHEDEAQTLREFWELTRGEMGRTTPLIGFNIFSFDLPFLIRRSWKQRVPVPWGLRRGRYWDDQLIDLREAWQLGDRQARGSLDCIARHLGVGAKNGDGKAFAELWRRDRPQAEAYLRNDLELTAKVADALGVRI